MQQFANAPGSNLVLPLAHILDDQKNREETIRRMLKVWADNQDPVVLRQFMSQVQRARENLRHEKGWTMEKSFLRLAEIPARMYYMMIRCFGQEWRNDPKTAPIFWRSIKKLRFNQTSMPGHQEDKLDPMLNASEHVTEETDNQDG